MNLRRSCTLLGIAVFAIASSAEASVHRVGPGGSIQAAIDGASPGDTILVEPGVYEETGNADFGIYLDSGGSATKLKLRDNRAVNSGLLGIRILGSRNQLKGNLAVDNMGDGIRVDGPGQGNNLQGNHSKGNFAAGIRISTNSTGARIKRNETRGNALDLVDENAACDSNAWQGNAFVTSSQACIE